MNWKVLLGLGVAAAAILVFASDYARTLLPVLLVAACPLSMIAMMFSMRHMNRRNPIGEDLAVKPRSDDLLAGNGATHADELRTPASTDKPIRVGFEARR
ncbi:hypothetical protein J0H33_06045 [bacterium]|nr:hypothetical protein [bacterium]